MHTAFSLAKLVPTDQLGKDPITAALLHTDRIILGTEKGALIVFDLSPAAEDAPASAQFVSRHDGFSKKPVDQLAVIKEQNALVCLAGGDISLHSLPGYSLLSSFSSQTKATASLFALSTTIHTPVLAPRRSNTGKSAASGQQLAPPEIHTTLAIACRRRLLIFSWVDGSWLPPTELSLPHQIRGMAFDESADKRRLVAGFSTGEYGVVTLSPYPNHEGRLPPDNTTLPAPTLAELFTPAVPLPTLATEPTKEVPRGKASALTGHLGGLGSVMSLSGLSTAIGGKKIDKNGVVAVPRGVGKGKSVIKGELEDEGDWLRGSEWGWEDDERAEGEVLAVRDNVLLALTSSGKLRHPPPADPSSSSVTYSSAVDETLVLPPYIVSLLAPPPPPATSTAASTSAIPPTPTFPSLAVHSIESLASVQSLSIPPSPAQTSLAEAPTQESAPPKPISARLLTANSSTSQPPILILTSSLQPAGSAPSTGLIATDQTLWIVNQTPWPMQIEDLGAQGEWEQSIRLLRRSGPSSSRVIPSNLLRKLSILHSLSLFNQLKLNLAVDSFISLNLNPAKVVSLYPEAISGKLFLEPSAREAPFGGRSKAQVEAAKEKEEQAALAAAEAASESSAALEVSVSGSPSKKKLLEEAASTSPGRSGGLAGAIRASASWRELPRSASLSPSPSRKGSPIQSQPTMPSAPASLADPKVFRTAVDELVRFLTDRRQKYAQALAGMLPSTRPSPSQSRPAATRDELLALPDLPLTQLTPDQLARVAQVVDTALFKSYLATKPVMVGPLCRIENWCEVEEVEELLSAKGKFRELLDLYNGKGMHDKAVKLLKKMADDEDDDDEKVGPTIRYLQKLGAAHLNLILETSKWVFEADPKAAMDIFIADLEEVESLPRHATMHHLERIGREACVAYLEHLVHTLGEEGPEFHEKLIELYLAEVHSTKASEKEAAYEKLLALLESSTAYRADRMLGRLPSEEMHQVRAILLGRLGRHEGALQIYVYQLEDHATAELYCSRVYANTHAMRPTIFLLLLRLYLRPRANHPLLFKPALDLISNHASQLDPIEVFDLLPPLVGVKNLQVWLERSLRQAGERRREGRVVRSLGRAALDEKEEKVVQLESRRVRIDEGRLCPQCHKRLGNSVIAIHSPVGEVTHYQCREAFIEQKGLKA